MALPPAGRILAASLTGALLAAGVASGGIPAAAAPTTQPAPASKVTAKKAPTSFTLQGRGFGHGWGMSQYGAYGAARAGKTWEQIMAFYYPGTTIGTLPAGASIRVKLSGDQDGNVKVKAAPGLTLTDSDGTRFVLPTGNRNVYWKVIRSGASFRLQTRGLGESYRDFAAPKDLGGKRWTFSATGNLITVLMPDKTMKVVRGRVSASAWQSTMRTINTLPVESYLRSVVPMEMPTSWAAEAVRSQAVAARSYAVRTQQRVGSSALYDICDTTACQVYQGYARISAGRTRVNETKGGDAAVAATAGKVVQYRGTVAFTQFASSNGGAAARGDFSYLAAHPDPYDGVVADQGWRRTVTAASLRSVFPKAGTVTALKVTARDGSGPWGGRVTTITVIGSGGTVKVSGARFAGIYGLRSTLFAVR